MNSTKLTYLGGLLTISFLLLTSLYLQIFQGILPCPLCSLQRLTFVVLGILFLAGFFLYRKKTVSLGINFSAILISTLGIFFAGRQVWLQFFSTANNNECGASLEYMLEVLPMKQVIAKVFSGSAECSNRGFEFLSLNMAQWALVWFGLFLGLSIYLFGKEIKKYK